MRVLLKLALIGLLWGGLISPSSAQSVGQLQPGQVWGNPNGSQQPATGATIQQILAQTTLTSLTINSAANTVPLTLTGGSTTGSGTTILGPSVSGTLNTTGVVDGASFFANITNTAVGAGSSLFDLQVGSSSKFKVGLGGAVTASSSFTAPDYYGGPNTNSTNKVASPSNSAPSGDILNLFGSTVNIGNPPSSGSIASVINIGDTNATTLGITVNIANSSNGLTALNVYNASGVKQQWVPGGGNTTITFPGVTDTLVALAATQTLTNKTLASTTDVLGGVTMTLGSDATGDIYYRNSSGVLTRLGIGTSGQVLQVNTGLPSCQAGSSAGSITQGSTTIGGTCPNGDILYSVTAVLGCTTASAFIGAGAGISVTGTTTVTIAVSLTTSSNILGGDVSLSNVSNYFDGPSMAQGTSGMWAAYGTVTITDTSSGANIYCKLWDGTNAAVASAAASTIGAGDTFTMTLSGNISSPAGNIRISCKDITSTSGKIKFNVSGLSSDSSIYGHRIQ